MESLDKILVKKAKGFHYLETVEEYSEEEGELRLVRRKVSKKYSPPDLAAIKAASEAEISAEGMSTEDLQKLREQLIRERDQTEKDKENKHEIKSDSIQN